MGMDGSALSAEQMESVSTSTIRKDLELGEKMNEKEL